MIMTPPKKLLVKNMLIILSYVLVICLYYIVSIYYSIFYRCCVFFTTLHRWILDIPFNFKYHAKFTLLCESAAYYYFDSNRIGNKSDSNRIGNSIRIRFIQIFNLNSIFSHIIVIQIF